MKAKAKAARPAAETGRRCAIYTRKSTSAGLDQAFSSLDAQREACLAYIERQPGWRVVDASYDDGGFTGANIERPAFQRLLEDIDAGRVDVVVVYKVDRLSRSLLDFVRVMERFNAAGTSFVSVTQSFSTADAMGRLTLNMLMSFAEYEREMIADRTRDKIAASRRKGKWTGGPLPFGYGVKDKRLVVNELEAIVVRQAFDYFLQHHQMALVARLLNVRGSLPRPPRRPGPVRWTKDSISRVLKNPIYAGFITYGDEVYAGEHPPIIEPVTWRQARRILDATEREVQFRGTNPDYILRGLLYCGRCNGRMCPGSTRKGSREHRYYRCSNRDKHGTCDAVALPARAIEEFVIERLALALAEPGLANDAKLALETRIEKRRTQLEVQRTALPTKIAAASARASRYAEELTRVDGKARQVLEAKLQTEADGLAKAESQLAAVQRDLAVLADDEADSEWVTEAMRDFPALWGVLAAPNRGRLLRAITDRVVVDEGARRVEISIVDFGADRSEAVA